MNKILNFDQLPSAIKQIKSHDTIILVGGCFDVLHPGHIEFLSRAKSLGGQLVVILESDEAVKRRKGEARPINTQQKRAIMLSTLHAVDYVLPIPNLTSNQAYTNLVKTLEPDIIAITNGDPIKKIKENQAEMVGGRVIEVMDRDPDHSTTNIIGESENQKVGNQ